MKQEAVAKDALSTMGTVGRSICEAVNDKKLRAGKPGVHAEEVVFDDGLLSALVPVKSSTLGL